MPSNIAAWQPTPGVPLEVREAPYTSPSADEIVIKNHAVAVNPADYKLQDVQLFPFHPTILGNDVAGEVVEVGSAVTRFKPGDRVLALPLGVILNDPARAGFLQYSVVLEKLASPIPNNVSYSDATVLPAGIATAACGLFQKHQLSLQYPSLSPKPQDQTLLVWGAASSVGVNAVQLAVAAGYEVFATASPRNFEFLRNIGASKVFDYNIEPATLQEQLNAAFDGKKIAGVFNATGFGGVPFSAAIELFSRVEGNKFLTNTLPLPDDLPADFKAGGIVCTSLKDDEVGDLIYQDFLPEAIKQGKYKFLPEAEIVGNGLEALQKGFDILRKGVSAKKLVVTLD